MVANCTVEQSSLFAHDLYVKYTYGESVDIIAVINDSPLFIYVRYAEQMNYDFKTEKPKFALYIYDEYSMSKCCGKCGFYSSEPSVNLKDDFYITFMMDYVNPFKDQDRKFQLTYDISIKEKQ